MFRLFTWLGWKPTNPFHGSEFKVVTCPVLLVWSGDISVPRAVGATALHLFRVVRHILIFPWQFCKPLEFCFPSSLSWHPSVTSSFPAVIMASLPSGPVAVSRPSSFWFELQTLWKGPPDLHLFWGLVSCLPSGHTQHTQLLLAGCCPHTQPHNPLHVVPKLQTGWVPKVYFAISWLFGVRVHLPGDSVS